VTRQRRRPAVGGGSAEVVSIGAGGTHRPDYSRLASGQVAAAHRHLGLSLEDFTRLINERTGWDVMPETVAAWEDDELPPGDVVLAAMAAAQGLPGVAEPLAIGIPPSFPAEVLAGHWVTAYQFSHAGKSHHHADIAYVTAESASRIRAVNHPPAPRTEGRSSPFRNEIVAELANRHLAGHWKNVSDSRYWGLVELATQPGETVMDGGYMGLASDILVSMGRWRWVRLDPASIPEVGLAGVTLRDPVGLYELIMNYSLSDEPLTLADVTEEP
jgi:hypothetical protein